MLHTQDLQLPPVLCLLTWISNFGRGGFVCKRTAYRCVRTYTCACECILGIFGASQWPPRLTSLLPSLEDCCWVTNEIRTWRKPEWPWETWRVPWWISVQSGVEGNGVKEREAGTRVFHISLLTRRRRQAHGEIPVTIPNLGEQSRARQAGIQCQDHVKGRSL